MLDKLLNKQYKIAFLNFLWGFPIILGPILLLVFSKTWVNDAYGGSGYYETNYALWYVGGSITLISSIAQLAIWIIGIVTAVKINSITGNSTILIVFAIIPLWFGLLIVAVIQRNKFRGTSSIVAPSRTTSHAKTIPAAPRTTSHEDKLKQSFMDGVITSAEYEKKLADHRSNK